MRLVLLSMSLLVGCSDGDALDARGAAGVDGLLGDGPLNPFPNAGLMDERGRVALPGDELPKSTTPLPLDRIAWREGFSPAQVSVVRLDDIDPSGFPSFEAPTPGLGSVRLADLTDGVWLPVMAELDAWPDANHPATLIRPLIHLPVGHRIGVVVTTEAVERPEAFDAFLAGPDGPQARELLERFGTLGVDEAEIGVAWDFQVGDGTRPLRSALEQVVLDGAFRFDRVRNLDAGDTVAPHTWRVAEGSYTVQSVLIEDRALSLDAGGFAVVDGEAEAVLYVHVPTSVADAPAGTVPVMIFGHGIFGEPGFYLDDPIDAGKVNAIADAAGMIVVATTWRGLTFPDRVQVIEAAQDFGKLPVVTDRLVQAQLNLATLVELVGSSAFVEHLELRGRDGQVLIDPSRLYYYGISLGAIEGMVALAQDPPFDAAVFHVGGSMWSTMLERSSNWLTFELFVTAAIPEPSDRQLLYAVSQLYWDPADPMSYAPELTERSFLLQESIGDEQVPNFTTEALARSVGLPLLTPSVTDPSGVVATPADLPPGSRALVQFDPEVPLPEAANRPARITGAHDLPRTWPGTQAQVLDYLRPGAEGRVVHHCGNEPCAASNPGE